MSDSANQPALHYCTNVHPCRSIDDLPRVFDDFTMPIAARAGFPVGAGLWLPARAIAGLQSRSEGVAWLADALACRGLACRTLNAFPYGDFHEESVKDRVYRPDWSTAARYAYTIACGEVLAGLMPAGAAGSVSTLPLGFKAHARAASFEAEAIANLIAVAVAWDHLRARDGRTIRLAIEPEPLCVLETTAEAIAFFERLWTAAAQAGVETVVREHVGLCYDVCHQAVEFEDAAVSLGRLAAAGIGIVKVHVSCALELDAPADRSAREALARFAEPRYLHQTFARLADGRIVSTPDLTAAHALSPPREWLEAAAWRVHFHVPVDASRLGPLGTTRVELHRALEAVGRLPEPPHLEVETYTWPVLAGKETRDPQARQEAIVAGLARELVATRAWLAAGCVAS